MPIFPFWGPKFTAWEKNTTSWFHQNNWIDNQKAYLTKFHKHHFTQWCRSILFLDIDRREYWSDKYDNCPWIYPSFSQETSQQQCHHLKKSLKRIQWETAKRQHKDNSKKLWKMVRQFWPSITRAQSHIDYITNKINDTEKAEVLSMHFCSVGSKVQSNITKFEWACPHADSQPPFLNWKKLLKLM